MGRQADLLIDAKHGRHSDPSSPLFVLLRLLLLFLLYRGLTGTRLGIWSRGAVALLVRGEAPGAWPSRVFDV